jgi:hypothetical protein
MIGGQQFGTIRKVESEVSIGNLHLTNSFDNLQLSIFGKQLTNSQCQRMLHSATKLSDMDVVKKLDAPSCVQKRQDKI